MQTIINSTLNFFLIILQLSYISCAFADLKQQSDWYNQARSFIYFDKKMIEDEAQGKETFLDNIGQRDLAGTRFKQSLAPEEKKVQALLRSSDPDEISIAAVSIALTEEFNPNYLQDLIMILKSKDDYFVKRYVLLAIDEAPSEEIRKYENSIIEHIINEKDEVIIFQEAPILLKLTPRKSAKALTTLLGRDSISLRRIVYLYLLKLGDNYAEEALDFLVKTKNIDKQNFVEELRQIR